MEGEKNASLLQTRKVAKDAEHCLLRLTDGQYQCLFVSGCKLFFASLVGIWIDAVIS